MKHWNDLTDEQRASVLGSLQVGLQRAGEVGDQDFLEAHETAMRVLAMAGDEWETAEAIADACEECGIGEVNDAEDVPAFIRRLRRERDEARAAGSIATTTHLNALHAGKRKPVDV